MKLRKTIKSLLGIKQAPITERSPEPDPIDDARSREAHARELHAATTATLEADRGALASAEQRLAATAPSDAESWHAAEREVVRLRAVVGLSTSRASATGAALTAATQEREHLEHEQHLAEQRELGSLSRFRRVCSDDINTIIEAEKTIHQARARLADRTERAAAHRATAGLPAWHSGMGEALLAHARGDYRQVPLCLGAGHDWEPCGVDWPVASAMLLASDVPSPVPVVSEELQEAWAQANLTPVQVSLAAERLAAVAASNDERARAEERRARQENGQPLSLQDQADLGGGAIGSHKPTPETTPPLVEVTTPAGVRGIVRPAHTTDALGILTSIGPDLASN